MKNNLSEVNHFLQHIQDGYVVSDPSDDDEFVVMVDENRKADENFKPSKMFVQEIEESGLVRIIDKETKRKYFSFDGKKHPMSLITIYALTEQGQQLINAT